MMAEEAKREATLADLEAYAFELAQAGYRDLYLWGAGPGVIRCSKTEPQGISRYVLLGERGRIWTIVEG